MTPTFVLVGRIAREFILPSSGQPLLDQPVALGLGAKVMVIDKNISRLREVENLFQWRIATAVSDQYNIECAVREADALIGAVLLKGEKTPHLVSEDLVKQMKPGSVIVDISIDQGGCVETSRPNNIS